MKQTVTIKFPCWTDSNGTYEKVVTFTNDGFFTTNSTTSLRIPQTTDMFEASIKAYVDNDEALIIN
jgi:hypothetical protein